MKANILSAVVTLVLVGIVSNSTAFAQDKATTEQSLPDAHHPNDKKPGLTDHTPMGADTGMMGKMDMNHMKGMMNDCMESKKDKKMCDQDMMDKCKGEMSQTECTKMMKQAKAHNSTTQKK
jgi:hypothetical protein